MGQNHQCHPPSAAHGLCCICPSPAGRSGKPLHPGESCLPQAAGLGLLPAGRQPPSLPSHPPHGSQQLELVSISQGPPSVSDFPAGRARIASGTQRAAPNTGTAQAAFCSAPHPMAAPAPGPHSAQPGHRPAAWLLPTPVLRGARPHAGVLAAGANATATPASARRTRPGSWSACVSTTRPAPTASAASPSTRIGPGLAAPPRPPTSVSVSICRAGSVVTVCGQPRWRCVGSSGSSCRSCTGRKCLLHFVRLLWAGREDLVPQDPPSQHHPEDSPMFPYPTSAAVCSVHGAAPTSAPNGGGIAESSRH